MNTKTMLYAVLCVLVVGGLGAFLFFFPPGTWEKSVIVSPTPLSGVLDPEEIAQAAEAPPGSVKYENATYGFSFFHAPEAKIVEYGEGNDAMTITLENFEKVRGLQIFIVPYVGDSISEERFHMDIPSGVRENVENTTVGLKKIPAVTFTSTDAVLGDTREIWFIYGGYLYEVTTFKGVKDWVTPIIQSWRFN